MKFLGLVDILCSLSTIPGFLTAASEVVDMVQPERLHRLIKKCLF